MSNQSVHEIRVTVGMVSEKGFVITYPEDKDNLPEGVKANESITFDLKFWEESECPTKGQVVILSNLKRFARGWRAFSVRQVIL